MKRPVIFLYATIDGDSALGRNLNSTKSSHNNQSSRSPPERKFMSMIEAMNTLKYTDTSAITNNLFLTNKDSKYCFCFISMESLLSMNKPSNGNTMLHSKLGNISTYLQQCYQNIYLSSLPLRRGIELVKYLLCLPIKNTAMENKCLI